MTDHDTGPIPRHRQRIDAVYDRLDAYDLAAQAQMYGDCDCDCDCHERQVVPSADGCEACADRLLVVRWDEAAALNGAIQGLLRQDLHDLSARRSQDQAASRPDDYPADLPERGPGTGTVMRAEPRPLPSLAGTMAWLAVLALCCFGIAFVAVWL